MKNAAIHDKVAALLLGGAMPFQHGRGEFVATRPKAILAYRANRFHRSCRKVSALQAVAASCGRVVATVSKRLHSLPIGTRAMRLGSVSGSPGDHRLNAPLLAVDPASKRHDYTAAPIEHTSSAEVSLAMLPSWDLLRFQLPAHRSSIKLFK